MYAATVGRTEIFKIFMGGEEALLKSRAFAEGITDKSGGRGKVILAWKDEPRTERDLPIAVIVDEREIKDFLAWASSYLAHLRPITSFVRLLNREEYDLLTTTEWQGPAESSLLPCVGLVVSEACLSASLAHIDPESLSLNACQSTLSYALGRSLLNGYNHSFFEGISQAWAKVRSLTLQPSLKWKPEHVLDPWLLWCEMSNRNFALKATGVSDSNTSQVLEALEEIDERGRLSEGSLKCFKGVLKGSDYKDTDVHGPRVDRVAVLERAIAQLSAAGSTSTSRSDSFLLGYLASRVGPGSMDHISLLRPCAVQAPAAFLWYGLLAGLHRESEVFNAGSGLGRWVLRELSKQENFYARPSHDVSIRELEVLSVGNSSAVEFRSANPSYLDVELIPLVRTRISTRRRGRQLNIEDFDVGEVVDERSKHVQVIAADLLRHVTELNRLVGSPKASTRRRSRKK